MPLYLSEVTKENAWVLVNNWVTMPFIREENKNDEEFYIDQAVERWVTHPFTERDIKREEVKFCIKNAMRNKTQTLQKRLRHEKANNQLKDRIEDLKQAIKLSYSF